MAAPDKSLRPKYRPDEDSKRKASEDFGDVEFRADLDETLKDDPISRLGFSLTKDSTYFGDSSSPNIGYSGNQLDAAHSGKHNEVFMSDTYGASKDAYSHEYRHAGFDALRSIYNEDPTAFEDKYGKDAALLLDEEIINEELVTELLDNPDATYMSEGKELPLSDTIQYVKPEKLRDAKEKGYYSKDSFRYGDIYTKGISGLKMAAQDLLFEFGEPPKYQDLSTGPKDRKGKRAEEDESIFSGFFKKLGFNEGGSVGNMDAQMKLFEEGGLTDDGTNIDPVSGNEVPPGSMAEEVRDDVPAQLSEGEYVVPADVVRYYGVRFFEDLRSQAKQGLGEMEANGRIGGEPVAQTMDNQTGGELTPEELAALEQVTGMAMGGMVQPQAPNPYLQQQQLMTQPQQPQLPANPVDQQMQGVLYAAEGVDVSAIAPEGTDPYKPQFTTESLRDQFGAGFLIDQANERMDTGVEPMRTVTLYSPEGKIVTLQLPQDQAQYEEFLSLGYSEEQGAAQVTGESAIGKADREDPGVTPTTAPTEEAAKFDLSADTETLKKQAKSLSLLQKAAGVTASLMGGGIGIRTIVNTNIVAQYNDIIDELNNRGENDEGLERKGSIFGGEAGLYDGLQDVDGDGNKDFGDTWLGDLLGFDEKGFGVQGAKLGASRQGARRSGSTTTSTTTTSSGGNNNDNDRTPPTTTTTSTPTTSTPKKTVTSGMDRSAAVAKAESAGVSSGYSGTVDTEQGGSMLNKGGMVKRRKKKK
jgi:hypothetical protein